MDRQVDANVFLTENTVEDCAGNKVVPVEIAREAVKLEKNRILSIVLKAVEESSNFGEFCFVFCESL